jgi:hypothetical protein
MFLNIYAEYVSGKRGLLPDDVFYALAGWKYIHGSNLDIMTLIHPPFAIYLIGLSELLFMNHVMLSLVASILTLIAVYLISKRLIQDLPTVSMPTLVTIALMTDNEEKIPAMNRFMKQFCMAWRIYDDLKDWREDLN